MDVKIIGKPKPVAENNIIVTDAVLTKLALRQETLTAELGFDVSISDVIAHMLRGVTVPVVRSEEAIKKEILDHDANTLVRQGQKINAIKLVRERTQMGLKEAKDYVEALPGHDDYVRGIR